MSAPSERHKALVVYCTDHRCKDCPMNDPELGRMDDEDFCIVSMAMDVFAAQGDGTKDPYWGAV